MEKIYSISQLMKIITNQEKPKVILMVITSNMKAMGAKIKIYHLKNILVWAYLSDIINDHKTPKVLKIYSGNKVTDYETTLGEWKIQLMMTVNFVCSKDDSDEIRTMDTKSDNI